MEGDGSQRAWEGEGREDTVFEFYPIFCRGEIGDGVATIGERAFQRCSKLTSASIAESVKEIGDYAFADCINLVGIVIPDSVVNLGAGAFAGCSGMTSASLGRGLKAIKDETFLRCSGLVGIVIPANIRTIGSNAFYACSQLRTVSNAFGLRSLAVGAFGGCGLLKTLTLPDSVLSVGAGALSGCPRLTDLLIPRNLDVRVGTLGISGKQLTDLRLWLKSYRTAVTKDRSRPQILPLSERVNTKTATVELRGRVSDNLTPVRVQFRLKAPRTATFAPWEDAPLAGGRAKAKVWRQKLDLPRRGTWQLEIRALDTARNASPVTKVAINRL